MKNLHGSYVKVLCYFPPLLVNSVFLLRHLEKYTRTQMQICFNWGLLFENLDFFQVELLYGHQETSVQVQAERKT